MIFSLIILVLIGNIGSVMAASLLLKIPIKDLNHYLKHIYAFSGGTLLGAAFLGMIPNAIQKGGYEISYTILGGILFFFLIEKIILWRMCGNENCDRHEKAGASMLMIGDSFHNFIDGIVITAAFMQSPSFGIMVAISVFAHEIPQEVSDFGVLIKSGFTPRKAILLNVVSGCAALIGMFIAYYFETYTRSLTPYILAISAASFIYIALADLIPELHKKTTIKQSLFQFSLMLLGIVFIYLSIKNKP